MIKHNLVWLTTHLKNVANTALIIARQDNATPEDQRNAWWLGLTHDTGWPNLRIEKGKFKHEKATKELLIELTKIMKINLKDAPNVDALLDFAKNHHMKPVNKRGEILKQYGMNPKLWQYVASADSLMTAVETPGYVHEAVQEEWRKVLRSFTTTLTLETKYHAINIARKHLHAQILDTYTKILQETTEKIRKETKVPQFNTIITADIHGIIYTLDEKSENEAQQKINKHLQDQINQELEQFYKPQQYANAILKGIPEKTWKSPCIFCQTISKKPSSDAQVHALISKFKPNPRAKGISLEYWRNKQRQKWGICPACLLSGYNLNRLTHKYNIAIIMPRIPGIEIRRKRITEAIKKWRELIDRNLCKPEPEPEEIIKIMMKTKSIIRYWEEPDTIAESYQYAKQIYQKTLEHIKKSLENTEKTIIKLGEIMTTITTTSPRTITTIADTIEGKNYTPILLNSQKTIDTLNAVVIGGMVFKDGTGKQGTLALKITAQIIANPTTKDLLQESETPEQFLANLAREETGHTIMKIINQNIETYTQIHEKIKIATRAETFP